MLLSMGYESLYYSIAHYFQQKLSMNLIHPATRVARWYALHASSNATLQLCTTKPLSGQRNTEHPAEVFSSLHPKNITDGVASREDFGSIRLHPALKNGLEKMKIHSPTLVQEKSWDPVFQGRSTLITAETGTGKTLAFALPIIQRLIANQGTSQPFSTVCLVPTRELAVQVHNVFVSLLNEVMGDKAVQYTHCVVKGMERSTVKKQVCSRMYSDVAVVLYYLRNCLCNHPYFLLNFVIITIIFFCFFFILNYFAHKLFIKTVQLFEK